jgi:uncharacterized protein (DUF2236 family)
MNGPHGVGLAAGGANVIMQLSMLPIGHAVAQSTVQTGRVDRHPFKRARTTITYLAVANGGTEADKNELRRQINHVHARVRSEGGAKVPYDAFDHDLQRWVAACLYWGTEDIYHKLHGPIPADRVQEFYRRGAAYGTTLQMPEQLWPADRDAFEKYWQESLGRIEMDDITREYLQGIAEVRFLPFPVDRLLRPLNRFLTLGFLPEQFRRELRMSWSPRQQARFDRLVRVTAAVNRRLPRAVREFPFNLLLRDARRRIRRGRPII